MDVTIFGTGYVGLVTGACLADAGNHVICVDIDQKKIDMLQSLGDADLRARAGGTSSVTGKPVGWSSRRISSRASIMACSSSLPWGRRRMRTGQRIFSTCLRSPGPSVST